MREGRGPDFVGIGAQKAGTTWLYDNMAVQPGAWMPPVKELHFFNTVCPPGELLGVETRGVPPLFERYRPALVPPSAATLRWLRRFYNEPPSTEWYHSLFPRDRIGDRVAGDITPAYATLDGRGVAFARRVLKPGCRVFLVVRNPIERTWSALKMLHRWRGTPLTDDDVASVLREAEEPTHRLRSDYARTIRFWRAEFSADFAVFRYGRLVEDPEAFLRAVLEFVGVPAEVELGSLGERSNADPKARAMPDAIARRLTAAFRPRIEALDELLPGVAAEWLGDEG